MIVEIENTTYYESGSGDGYGHGSGGGEILYTYSISSKSTYLRDLTGVSKGNGKGTASGFGNIKGRGDGSGDVILENNN